MSNKAQKRGLVPELRFPAFRDAGEWTNKSMGEVYSFKGNNSLSRDKLNYESGSIKNIHYGDIHTKFSTLFDILKETVPYINSSESQESFKAENYCVEGDMVFADASEDLADIGKCIEIVRLNGERVVSGLHTILARQSSARLVIGFGGYLFKSQAIRKQIQKESQGAKVLGLSGGRFAKITISFPSDKAEQQKIADCLASLDERITLEAQKLDMLKTHKKGLMQQLFPAAGETLPKLRFPEFRNAGEWEEKLIEDFFDVGSSKRVLQQDWTTQGVPFYRTRELVSLSKNESFGSEIFISEELFREISENYGLPTEGDFLVSGVGTLGISYQVQAQDRFYFKDGNVLWFKLKDGIVSTFFKYCFEADEIQNQILCQASISTVGTYTIQNAKVTKFSCPPNTEEQQKIADCLASLDDLITAQTQKLAALKTHKKGLMQQLFPSNGGVPRRGGVVEPSNGGVAGDA